MLLSFIMDKIFDVFKKYNLYFGFEAEITCYCI